MNSLPPIIDLDQPHSLGERSPAQQHDYAAVIAFLTAYSGNQATLTAYRRECEKLLQWSWNIADCSVCELDREAIESFIQFCQSPPESWIANHQVPRRITVGGAYVTNPAWRPFVRKRQHNGKMAYQLSANSMRALFAVLGSLYDFLQVEEYCEKNPIKLIRQKSRYLQKHTRSPQIIRLSHEQWNTCVATVTLMADKDPARHERSLFIIQCMYLMYCRISELVASERWSPSMNHFFRDSHQQWWFKTLGKGNKIRHIAVSDSMLDALARYRKSLGLSNRPTPNEHHPLIHKLKGGGPMTSTRQVRRLIELCFTQTAEVLRNKGETEEAQALAAATAHWLRHTGISDDVNNRQRPILHVRDDAGHASITTTEGYSDVILQERHQSAKQKKPVHTGPVSSDPPQ